MIFNGLIAYLLRKPVICTLLKAKAKPVHVPIFSRLYRLRVQNVIKTIPDH